MNRKNGTFGIALVLFAAVFIFVGCQQPVATGNGSDRDGAYEKDSLLIEVWDNSTPPKFLGYDTGIDGYYSSNYYYSNSYGSRPLNYPVILTSKGYCVMLGEVLFRQGRLPNNYEFEEYPNFVQKISYGNSWFPFIRGGYYDYNDNEIDMSDYNVNNKFDIGSSFAFATTSNPTANDTAYFLYGANYSTNYLPPLNLVANYVFYNPHDGGTYYTYEGTTPQIQNVHFPPYHKIRDELGIIRTRWEFIIYPTEENPNLTLEEYYGFNPNVIGYTGYAIPLKRIGGYSALGLPDPNTIKLPLVFKVK